MSSDDLTAIEPLLGALAAQLKPGQRRQLAGKIGRLMRKQNAARIARNVDPDGAAMEPRKRRSARHGGKVKRKGKMFPKIRKIQALRVKASADGVEVGFTNPMISRTASVHQFGEVGYVGRDQNGQIVRTRYPARRLLGFGADDQEAILDLVLEHLSPG